MPEILITSDVGFYNEFSPSLPQYGDIKTFNKIQKEKLIELRDKEVNWVLLDGNVVKHVAFEDFRKLFKREKTMIFYIKRNVQTEAQEKQINNLAKMYDIHLLPEEATPRQIAHMMKTYLVDETLAVNDRMFAFFGTHGGVGVTTTSLNVAKALADNVDGEVLYLSLDTHDPASYMYNYTGSYLDIIKADLQYGEIDGEELKNMCHKVQDTGNLYHLAGNRDIKLKHYYTSKEIDSLMESASHAFDVIIVDAGSSFDTAPSVQSVIQAGTKFLITTQEPKGYRGKFPLIKEQLLKPMDVDTTEFQLIVNKYSPVSGLLKDSEIENEIDIKRISKIPDEQNDIIKTTVKGGFHTDLGTASYKESMEELANYIINTAELTRNSGAVKKKARKGIFG